MKPAPAPGAAQVTIERIVEWPDTDAAGHYHHSTVMRWAEAAEAELYERLGILRQFGRIPRVRYEVDYQARLWFRDRVAVTLRVADLGRSSVRYVFVAKRAGEVAATGSMTAVQIDPATGNVAPWTEEERAALSGTGDRPERSGPVDGRLVTREELP